LNSPMSRSFFENTLSFCPNNNWPDNNTFTIGDDQIPLYWGPQSEIPLVAKVTVPKRTVVPPHSVVRIPVQLDVDLSSFIVESSPQCQGPLLVPRCFFHDGNPTLCVFNPTESPYTLRKNAVIAQAYELVNWYKPNLVIKAVFCLSSSFILTW
jgi:hypothetical protein